MTDADKTACPACRLALMVPAAARGRAVRCPACKAVFGGPAATPPPPRIDAGPRLRVGHATSVGRLRERNEDSLLCVTMSVAGGCGLRDVALLAVADGMGGHAAGDRAGKIAVEALARTVVPHLCGLTPEDAPGDDLLFEWLDLGFYEAHRSIRAEAVAPAMQGMGATVVAAVVVDRRVCLSHLGDCRGYVSAAGAVRQLTRDMTLAMRMVEMGALRPDQAKRHPSASRVTQWLGGPADPEPSRLALPLAAGEVLVLACDGLHADMDEAEFPALIDADPAETARRLVRRAGEAGGSDNCTVIVAG